MNRRKFIKRTAVGITGLMVLPACVYEVTPYQYFTEEEAKCIIALTDQIIPTDESGPGAAYANVVNYIDKQLVNVFKLDQPIYRKGIVAVQMSCEKMYGKLFEELDFDTQTKYCALLESENKPKDFWNDVNPSSFFNMVIAHTMQGFYGSPRHGGNKNYISYRLMDLEYPLVIGQNRYRRNNG